MRVLVTGCVGFIGSRVCEMLLADGHEVLGVNVGWNLEDMPYEYYTHDIRYPFPDLDFDADAVINLAAFTGVRASVDDPVTCYQTNVIGTINLMDWALHNNVQKFVQISSSSVYGDQIPFPTPEYFWTGAPKSPYAASKAAAEQVAYVYHHLYKLDISVLRYFTVYGPAGRPDMAVFRFIKWLVEEEPIIVYGSGEQARDFTYVDDIARGTIAALQPMGYRVINLGSGRPFSLMEIIEKLEGIVGKKANIKFMPPSPADVPVTHADITLAGELLNWQPSVSIDDGLAKTVAWYMENREWAKELA